MIDLPLRTPLALLGVGAKRIQQRRVTEQCRRRRSRGERAAAVRVPEATTKGGHRAKASAPRLDPLNAIRVLDMAAIPATDSNVIAATRIDFSTARTVVKHTIGGAHPIGERIALAIVLGRAVELVCIHAATTAILIATFTAVSTWSSSTDRVLASRARPPRRAHVQVVHVNLSAPIVARLATAIATAANVSVAGDTDQQQTADRVEFERADVWNEGRRRRRGRMRAVAIGRLERRRVDVRKQPRQRAHGTRPRVRGLESGVRVIRGGQRVVCADRAIV